MKQLTKAQTEFKNVAENLKNYMDENIGKDYQTFCVLSADDNEIHQCMVSVLIRGETDAMIESLRNLLRNDDAAGAVIIMAFLEALAYFDDDKYNMIVDAIEKLHVLREDKKLRQEKRNDL